MFALEDYRVLEQSFAAEMRDSGRTLTDIGCTEFPMADAHEPWPLSGNFVSRRPAPTPQTPRSRLPAARCWLQHASLAQAKWRHVDVDVFVAAG